MFLLNKFNNQLSFISTKKYRPEIDGLRAIAVLAVLFFHMNSIFFPGGFIGVDIFFVISGYLITKILIENSKDKNFKLIHFFERRVRRILPALFTLILTVYLFNFLILDKDYLENFEATIRPTILFYSNFYFWLENSDYFAPINSLKILLHTWSLSIEEQFYLIYPILFIVYLKYSKNFFFIILLFVFFASILFCHMSGSFEKSFPFIDFKNISFSLGSDGFLFFLTPARIWELLLGCIVCLKENRIKKYTKDVHQLYLFFAFLVIFFFFIFGDQVTTPSPSIMTLIPLLSLCFIIIFFDSNKNSLISKILTSNFLVSIGLISYSLYLWHHPIINLKNYYFIYENNFLRDLFFILLIFTTSFFSWQFIEKPFRKKNLSFKRVFCFLSLIIIVIFFVHYLSSILKQKPILDTYKIDKTLTLTNEQYDKKLLQIQQDWINSIDSKFNSSKKKFLIFGDSHARDIFLSLKYIEKKEKKFDFQFFIPDEKYKDQMFDIRIGDILKNYKDTIENSTLFKETEYIILAPSYNLYDLKYLSGLIKFLEKKNKKIIIFNQNPMWKEGDLRKAKYYMSKYNLPTLEHGLYQSIKSETYVINERLFNLSQKYDLKIVDRFSFICNKFEKNCKFLDTNFKLLFLDYGPHFTKEGIRFIADEILKRNIFNIF